VDLNMSNKLFFATVALVATAVVGVQSSNAQSFPATFGANVNASGSSSVLQPTLAGASPTNASNAKVDVTAAGPNGAAARASVGGVTTLFEATSFGVGAGGTNGRQSTPVPLTGPGAGGSFNTAAQLGANAGQFGARLGGGTTTNGSFIGNVNGGAFSNVGSFGASSAANFNVGGSGGTASAGGLGAQGQP
jgi:hypothetical protein